jgi:transcriptional regulator NrdR family protein
MERRRRYACETCHHRFTTREVTIEYLENLEKFAVIMKEMKGLFK